MRIAIGTDDGTTVRRGLFGDSAQFVIFTLKEGGSSATESRPNTLADPTLPDKPPRMLAFLADCDVFVSRSLRTGAFDLFARNGKRVLVTSHETIADVTASLAQNDMSHFREYDAASGRFLQDSRPLF